jgi:short-subunit dehydrogenase
MTYEPRSILITGASSGIGRALALAYARDGVHLALAGRNGERLEAVAAACRAKGARVTTGAVDVRERQRLHDWIMAADDAAPIDLAIANAGVTAGIGMGRHFEHADLARHVIATNLVGTMNTLDPVVTRMCMRGRGQLAVMGSIGALRGLPYCPAYSASKAGVHAYAEALRGALARHGIGVSIIAPGFIETPFNGDIVCPKPLSMSAERAAEIIRRGLMRGHAVVAFPRILYYALLATRLLPRRFTDAAFARVEVDIPEKFDPPVG